MTKPQLTEKGASGGTRQRLAGDAPQVIDLVGRHAEAGLEYLVCQFPHRDQVELVDRIAAFAEQVMPAFRP